MKNKEKQVKNKEIKKKQLEEKKIAKENEKKLANNKYKDAAQDNSPIWEYAGKADLTIGEQKISNTAKVILLLLLATLIAVSIFAYLKRDYIYDYISNPQIALTDEYIELEVGSKFDAKNYIVEQDFPARYEVTLPKNSVVNTKTLGTYEAEYKLKTSTNESNSILKVKVVDTTPPVITLTETVLKLERGEQTKKFDPKKYIKSITDNYDKEITDIEYTNTFDWKKDRLEVVYSAKDSSNNITSATLNIVVSDPPKEPEVVYVEPDEKEIEQKVEEKLEEERKQLEEEKAAAQKAQEQAQQQVAQQTQQQTQQSTPVVEQPQAQPQPQAQTPYINGVHDFTVKVGDIDAFTSEVQKGVYGSGYISVDYSQVNLTIAGQYPVVYSSSDGVTETATVTVVE